MSTTATMTDLRNLRVDQVGGLCAPPGLRRVFDDYKRGDAGESELDHAKDDAIRHVIAQPVASSPRSSNNFRAAAKSCGVVSGVIWFPG